MRDSYLPSEWKTSVVLRRNVRLEDQVLWAGVVRAENVQLLEAIGFDHFGLPRYRDTAGAEFTIERRVALVDVHTLHR